MRIVACVLLVITVLVGAFFGYVYYGAHMEILGVATSMVPATEVLATYEDILAQLDNGAFLGKQYHETDFLMPESFAFLTLTARLSNKGLFPMDWLQIEVEPDASDILQLYQERTPSLAGGNRADFSTTLLTRTGADASRLITVHYYFFGYKMSVSYQMGGS